MAGKIWKMVLIVIASLSACHNDLYAQKEGNIWVMAADTNRYLVLDFNFEPPEIRSMYSSYRLNHTNIVQSLSNICDSKGKLQHYLGFHDNQGAPCPFVPKNIVYGLKENIIDTNRLIIEQYLTNANLFLTERHKPTFIYVSRNQDSDCDPFRLPYKVSALRFEEDCEGVKKSQNKVIFTPSAGDRIASAISATRHANGRDWWLAVKDIDSTGLGAINILRIEPDTTILTGRYPIRGQKKKYTLKSDIGEEFNTVRGEMFFSPDGSFLATLSESGTVDVLSFDRCSGVMREIYNGLAADFGKDTLGYNYYLKYHPGSQANIDDYVFWHCYGGAFSPDNSKLYLTCRQFFNYLYQLDFANQSSPKKTFITASPLLDTEPLHFDLGQLENAVNGKIYLTLFSAFNGSYAASDSMGVINFPNQVGVACDFKYLYVGRKDSPHLPNMPNFRLGPYAGALDMAGRDTVITLGDSLSLGLPTMPGLLYRWESGENAATAKVSPDYSTTYTLVVTDPALSPPCNESYHSVCIKVLPSFGKLNEVVYSCGNITYMPLTRYDTLRYEYSWSPPTDLDDPKSPAPLLNLSANRTYTLTVREKANDSVFTKTVRAILVSPPAALIRTTDTAFCGSATLRGFGGLRYVWNTRDTKSEIAINASGTYSLTVTDAAGCTSFTPVSMREKCSGGDTLKFPTAFSPNGDELNDVFSFDVSAFSEYTMRIYDRWGVLLYEGNRFWDGSYDGVLCPEGVYAYKLEGSLTNGDRFAKVGTLTVIK